MPNEENNIKYAPLSSSEIIPVEIPETTVVTGVIYQQVSLVPKLEGAGQSTGEKKPAKKSPRTTYDYQPKRADSNAKTRYKRRAQNIFMGIIMFAASIIVFLPFIFAATNVSTSGLPFVFTFSTFNPFGCWLTFSELVQTIGLTNAMLQLIPNMLLLVGLVFVFINLARSFVAIVHSVEPKKYAGISVFYLLPVLAIFIMYLVGIDALNITAVNVKQLFVNDAATSELVTLLLMAVGYVLVAMICACFSSRQAGYTGRHHR